MTRIQEPGGMQTKPEQWWRIGSLGRGLLALLAVAALAIMLCAPRESHGQSTRADSVHADSALEARVRQVAAQLRCPVCQAVSLADSPSGLSQEMMDVLREQLAAGKSAEEVKAYFVGRYGEWILLEPKAEGWNLLVYSLPVGLVLIGAVGIVYAVRRWTRPPGGDE